MRSYPCRTPQAALALALALCGACTGDTASTDADGGADSAVPDNDVGQDAGTGADTDADAVPPGCENAGTDGATARCLTPTLAPEHYVTQALAYFDTLDIDADRASVPDYAPLVARWEWPPWLLLTAFGADDMNSTADSLRTLDPSTVPERDCRFFEAQPFARCYIVFEYEEGRCPIYEEFVFNDAGQVTFIEAWSDQPGMMPMDPDADPWAEGDAVARLSTRVPGLGTADGIVALDTPFMLAASEDDADLADFALRASDWWRYWFELVASVEPNYFAVGCGWDEEP